MCWEDHERDREGAKVLRQAYSGVRILDVTERK